MSHSSFFLSGICYYRLTEKKPWSKSFWTTMCPSRLQRPGISVVKTWVCVEILFLKVGKDLLYNNNNIIIVISNKKVLGKTMSPNPAWYIHNITLGAYHFSVMHGQLDQPVCKCTRSVKLNWELPVTKLTLFWEDDWLSHKQLLQFHTTCMHYISRQNGMLLLCCTSLPLPFQTPGCTEQMMCPRPTPIHLGTDDLQCRILAFVFLCWRNSPLQQHKSP